MTLCAGENNCKNLLRRSVAIDSTERASSVLNRFRSSHTSDSGNLFRIKRTSSAGKTERKKHNRHPISGATNPPTSDASTIPNGAPVCITAPYLPRTLGGKDSPTYVWPVAHSPPTPRPVIILKSSSTSSDEANPHRNVPTLYVSIVHCSTLFRPKRSERIPKITPPIAVAARDAPRTYESPTFER